MAYYDLFTNRITECLKGLEVTEAQNSIAAQRGFEIWCEASSRIRRSRNQMFLVGNGASAAMAAHMSADAFKNGGLLAHCFNESSLMTAIANDISYEQVFSYPLKQSSNPGDVLVTISSSGNSPNIVSAIQAAKEKGLYVITLSGINPDNKSRAQGDLNFYIPSKSYGIVESSHQVLLHCWLDMFMDLKPD